MKIESAINLSRYPENFLFPAKKKNICLQSFPWQQKTKSAVTTMNENEELIVFH